MSIHVPQQGSILLAEGRITSAVMFVQKVWISSKSTGTLGNSLNATWILQLKNSEICTQLKRAAQEHTQCTCVHRRTSTHPSNIYRLTSVHHMCSSHICSHLELQLSFRFLITLRALLHSNSPVATLLMPTSTGKPQDFFKAKCHIYCFTAFMYFLII